MAGQLNAGHGWTFLIAAIVLWEIACSEDELLSRGFDRYLQRHPWWPRLAVTVVALHLNSWVPRKLDVFSLVVSMTRVGGRNERLIAWGKHALSRLKTARKSSA